MNPELVAPLAALAALVLSAAAEALHARRVRRLAPLAFGPSRRPAGWARAAPYLRVAALSALAWGIVTLFTLEPRRYATGMSAAKSDGDFQHVLIVLDVSPSMRLVDAGPEKKVSRMTRARALIESFFDRVPIEDSRVSVVAVYNGAKPVVVDTKDFEVVRNIFGDLPMHYAFPSGKTKLFDGLEEAVKIAKPWNPRSATLLVLSDGDTLPATGMPKMPPSIRSVLIVGVGDSRTGKFIDGRQSRQDIPTLKQMAARLGGTFHDGNEKHLSSGLIASSAGLEEQDVFEKLTRRDYALMASLLGALILAFLPVLLHFFGTRWRPGTKPAKLAARIEQLVGSGVG
ncbi:MAG TPA: VWA domain-containing protein [Planctomycetota bacterium]|nr:VWA domain-containing protein [Planctomycetota bacterium]